MIHLGKFVCGVCGGWLTPTTYIQLAGAGSTTTYIQLAGAGSTARRGWINKIDLKQYKICDEVTA